MIWAIRVIIVAWALWIIIKYLIPLYRALLTDWHEIRKRYREEADDE